MTPPVSPGNEREFDRAFVGMGREHGMVQRLRRALVELGVERPARVLAGYSGGADSLALLSLLRSLANHGLLELRSIHVDHGVRAGSAMDADLARGTASALGIPLDIRRVPGGRLAWHCGVGREEAMRRERYLLFAETASEHDADVVALAHHQRDQAETVLLHLLRGSGIRGASGMRTHSHLTVPWWGDASLDVAPRTVAVWRPLLSESADDIRDYAESLRIPIAEDPSNADRAFRRNALRSDVLPLLEQVSPGAIAGLARFAALAGEDSAFLDRLARQYLEGVAGTSAVLDRDWLIGLPVAMRRRVLQFWIAQHASRSLETSLNRLDEVLKVAATPGPVRTVELGMGYVVAISREHLSIGRAD